MAGARCNPRLSYSPSKPTGQSETGERAMASRHGKGRFDRRSFLSAGVAAGASLAFGGLTLRAVAQDRRLTTVGGTAKTQYGSVRGLVKEGVQQFWCVPYGAPTSGANRFMP